MLNALDHQKVLIVDDESGIREGLKASLEHLGFDVETAESGEKAIQQFKKSPDVSFVLSDYRMPGMTGFDVVREVKRLNPQTKVVLMTGYGSVNHAVQAMQMGADDYLCKPFSVSDLERIMIEFTPKPVAVSVARIITEDPEFIQVLKKAERAAKSAVPILIEGESGTGKELLARQIHDWSVRQDKPWVAINCAALPAGLLESELFGFERGAFTGATERKAGKFEQADTGTLLLDEIGELDPILQAKLLRVLQEGEVDRLGGKKPLKVDVRVVATTNRNLEKLVREGKFREDLYFRLYGVRFVLPPLRARKADIALLAEEFLTRQSEIQGRTLSFDEGVVRALQNRRWSGNIRELERAVERAAVLAETGTVTLSHFEFDQSRVEPAVSLSQFGSIDSSASSDATKKSIKEMEKDIILKALEAHGGNRTHTAKALGMSLRTLRHKLKVYRDAGTDIAEYTPATSGQDRIGNFLPSVGSDAELGGLNHSFPIG
jgi:DNA-binding NtrC family response regulator